jgi:diguanylate cyclase (GGDEF)-like protein
MKRFEELAIQYFIYLETKGKTFNFLIGLLSMALIGTIDIFAPDDSTHSFLYLLPITFVTWLSGYRAGLVMVLLGTLLWSINNVVDSLAISAWNILSTLLFFSAISVLLHKTKTMWANECILSRTDPLTGSKNLRAFTEIVEYEILRAKREGLPFSLAYLDLDNFKHINDTYGHTTGDDILKTFVSDILQNVRKTDVVARLGGDEFAIFLPDTDQSSVRIVMEKMRSELNKVAERNRWPVTFSIGVLTCSEGACELDAMISGTDQLMYQVKNSGKNNIHYNTFPLE